MFAILLKEEREEGIKEEREEGIKGRRIEGGKKLFTSVPLLLYSLSSVLPLFPLLLSSSLIYSS
ncbi:hypothetical protein [Fibrella forsythiae]|uniref:Uncharacterized protein n=1 Tax=Fibrella forsythiae TaxID=2817061 RepID=A0ABS3JM19_9BACT|nr:hypothetical protein [Fibrella forsythiae]MBO0950503.1 hypothetical protein [Fibrella forsythiae]